MRRPWRVAAAAIAGILILMGVIIVIRQPDGTEIRIPVPPGSKVTIEPDDAGKKAPKPLVKMPDAVEAVASPRLLEVTRIGDGTAGMILSDNDQIGTGIAEIGDLDGDGMPDLALGAHGDSTAAPNSGALHILFRNADGSFRKSVKIADGSGSLKLPAQARFGTAIVPLGDLDGDGVPELAVGAFGDDGGHGALHLLYLRANGTLKASKRIGRREYDLPLQGKGSGDFFGFSAANLGDVHGDGGRLLAVGAVGSDDVRGCVYLLKLSKEGTLDSHLRIGHGSDRLRLKAWDRFGSGIAFLGPLKKGGDPALAVGSFGCDGDDVGNNATGAFYVLFLKKDGGISALTKFDHSSISGLPKGGNFGYALAPVGDLNGDGVPDLAASAVQQRTGERMQGAIYLLTLNEDGSVQGQTRIAHDSHKFPAAKDVEFGAGIARLSWPRDKLLHLAVGGGPEWLGGRHRGSVYLLDLEVGKR